MTNCYTYLPSDIEPIQVLACFGLISDTHFPAFCPSLPPILFEIFKDVNLILHAGDVGELTILDDLSRIAPVVAVRGNGDSDEAKQVLPLQQIIVAGGQRIFLYHSHHEDHELEMQAHREDRWQPKLDERIALGHQVGAGIVIFGHTHIPMTYENDGVLLINPGAIISASVLSRQLYQTVALLFILKDGQSRVVHIDLSSPQEIYVPKIDRDHGFSATIKQLTVSLIDPELAVDWLPFETYLRNFQAEPGNTIQFNILYEKLLCISRRCWNGEQDYITRKDMIDMIDEASREEAVSSKVISDLKKLVS